MAANDHCDSPTPQYPTLIFSCLYHPPSAARTVVITASGAVFATVLAGCFFFRRTSVEGLAGTTWPFLSSSASSWAASGVNSSVTTTPSSGSSNVTREIGNECLDREGADSSASRDGEVVCLRLVGLFFVLVTVRDFRDRDADLRRSAPEGGLDPDWNGFSSENGLVPDSSDSRFNRASGSSILTEGSKTACAGTLLRGLRTLASTSGSVSDTRDALVVLRRLGVFVLLVVEGTAFSADKSDLLFRLRGVLGGGINAFSASSSPSTVPS